MATSDSPTVAQTSCVPSAVESAAQTDPDEAPTGRVSLPLDRLLPSHWRLYALCACTLSGILAGLVALSVMEPSDDWRIGAVRIEQQALRATAETILTWLCTVVLVLSSQLAVLIRWRRSHSLEDFSGRYRTWWWIALLWLAAGFGVIAEAVVRSERHGTIAFTWSLSPNTWLSLGTIGIVALVGLRLLWGEVRVLRINRLLALLAAGSWSIWAVSSFAGITPWSVDAAAICPATMALGTWSVFVLMLWQARYVIHVCVDPPAVSEKPGVLRRLGRFAGQHLTKRRLRRTSAETDQDDAQRHPAASEDDLSAGDADAAEADSAAATDSTRTTVAPDDRAAPNPPESVTDAAEPADPSSETRSVVAESNPSVSGSEEVASPQETATSDSQRGTSSLRVDQAIDPGRLKGLSKRQRRQLRKQWREAQRAAAQSPQDA